MGARRSRHLLAAAAVLLAGAVLAGAGATQTPQPPTPAPDAAAAPAVETPQIARGRYLAVLGDCAGCHDRPGGAPYSGGVALNTPFGVIYSANITADRDSGIGSWSADDFWNAMHRGVRKGGAKLYPAFPYAYYTHVSRAESDALYAYLRSVPAASYRPPANRLPFPLNMRVMVTFWDWLYFKPDAPVDPGPGAHIVQGLGHCGACHTPKTFLGGDKTDRAFQGGKLDNWFAPAINADARRGLGAWSGPDVVEYLKTGRNERANASASMADVIIHSTSQMNDADLQAVAAYLKARPAPSPASPPRPDPKVMAMGQAIYVDQCSACHKVDGTGVPRAFPPLGGAAVTQSDDPTTIVRFILSGTQTVATDARPTQFSMPAYGWKLDDREIAAVATYVRNSWGNAASAVRPGEVGGLRRKVAAHPIRKPSAKI
jgi:mono/diheme cytochrome c family protein